MMSGATAFRTGSYNSILAEHYSCFHHQLCSFFVFRLLFINTAKASLGTIIKSPGRNLRKSLRNKVIFTTGDYGSLKGVMRDRGVPISQVKRNLLSQKLSSSDCIGAFIPQNF